MNAATSAASNTDWRDQIFEVLQNHDIKQVYHVPDAGHSRLIEHCQRSNSIRTVPLTTEEEGIALAAGAWLGGQRSALLMQSSGVGNTINMMGLTKTLRFPFLSLITMRGDYGEFNSWQYPMGQGTPRCSRRWACCSTRSTRPTRSRPRSMPRRARPSRAASQSPCSCVRSS